MARPLAIPLDGAQRAEMQLRAGVSESTLVRCYRGTPVSPYARRRIVDAARLLALPLPPEKKAA